MRFVFVLLVFAVPVVGFAQSVPTGSAQASTLLQQSLAAQTGGAAITDVTLNGTVTFLKGDQKESCPVALTALAGGKTQVVFERASGTVTEVWSASTGVPTVTGNGPNGLKTEPAGQNPSMPAPLWFSPALLTSLISSPTFSSSIVGKEVRNGASVQHITFWRSPSESVGLPAFVAQQARDEIYLDPVTALPFSVVVQVRPSNPAGSTKPVSIRARPAPEEIRYADYRSIEGRSVPFHIQVFLGEAPMQRQIMDIILSSVSVNAGAIIASN